MVLLVAAVPGVASSAASEPHVATSAWKIQPIPSIHGGAPVALGSVACPTANRCVSVGTASRGRTVPLAEHLNGATWVSSTVTVPRTVVASSLNGVACLTPTRCVAVGSTTIHSGGSQVLAERWTGAAWRPTPGRDATGATYNDLNAVACSTSRCEAVGFSSPSHLRDTPLVESWNGSTWTLQQAALPAGAQSSTLDAVSCRSSTWCVAVGQMVVGTAPHTLAELWNGTKWSVLSTPDPPGAVASFLRGVSCSSAARCLAAGSYVTSGGVSIATAERWNGAAWSLQPPALPAHTKASYLEGVDCVSASVCVAVGKYSTTVRNGYTLVERLDGATWAITSSPRPPRAASSELHAVACTSKLVCEVVGIETFSSRTAPLAARTVGLRP